MSRRLIVRCAKMPLNNLKRMKSIKTDWEDGHSIRTSIFSSLGFYPVCPGTPYYVIGTPLFEEARSRLPNGKLFILKAPNVSSDNYYIRRVRWNGTEYPKSYITHEMILSGGVLELEMADSPCKEWGVNDADCPPSMTE